MSIQITPIPRLTVLTAPAFTLGTANAAGSASTAIASDSTLLLFDAVAVDAITLGQTGSVGTATVPPRRDHAHAMEALTAANQAAMEAASSTTVFVTPGVTQYHPGVAKAYVSSTSGGDIEGTGYNVGSIVHNGPGDYDAVFGTDFAEVTYTCTGCLDNATQSDSDRTFQVDDRSTTDCQVLAFTDGAIGNNRWFAAFFGDQ